MTVILGVDPGLANCGWALCAAGVLVEFGCVTTKPKKGVVGDSQRRLEEVGRGLFKLIVRADQVVVEWPGFGGARRPGAMNATAASQTAAAAAMIVGLAWGRGRKTLQPAPITWRSKLGHKRGADEQLHAELARRYHHVLHDVQQGALPHLLDAIGLCLYGELVNNRKKTRSEQLQLVA